MKLAVSISCSIVQSLSWLYLLLLLGWGVANLVLRDRNIYVALANLVAVNFFLPLPLVVLVALACRSSRLAIGAGLGVVAFLWMWGALFLPQTTSVQAGAPTFKVLTYNVLYAHRSYDLLLNNIHQAGADVVLLQEVSPEFAGVLHEKELQEYPYQILVPQRGAQGMAILSKHPLHPSDEKLPHRWIGGPLIARVDWNGMVITVVNFHMLSSTSLSPLSRVEQQFRAREEQARLLADLAARSGSTILGGDANSTPLNDSYRILSSVLDDGWREAGFGLGHTFPAESNVPGSHRPRWRGRWVSFRAARIDYVFHTRDWEAVDARVLPSDGVSDHRGVVVTLRRRP